jgi:hypothetical protein
MNRIVTGVVLAIVCLTSPADRRRGDDARHASDALPAGVLPQLVKQIQDLDARYHPRMEGPGADPVLVAANPAHRFASRYHARGVSLRIAGSPALEMNVSRVRVDDRVHPLVTAPWTVREGRIERTSTSGAFEIVEWYLNASVGLEQGFTIDAPADRAAAGTSTIGVAIDVGSAWTPRLDAGGRTIHFDGPAGERLRYGHLAAWDARGRALPARLAADGQTIAVSVDVEDARYPVTIDPFIQQAQLLAPAGVADAFFGWSVAIDRDTAVVAAPFEVTEGPVLTVGAGYVFTRRGGLWSFEARLGSSGAGPVAGLGWDVAVEGNTAVLGAPFGGGSPGVALVFTRSGSTWAQQAVLTGVDTAAFDLFGFRVAIDGETVLVGAPAHEGRGAAYVFTRTGNTWAQQAELGAGEGEVGDLFGVSVGLDGSTAVIGAQSDDVGAVIDQGAAYVFTGSGSVWTESARVSGPEGTPGTAFGASVAVGPDYFLVGAPNEALPDSGGFGAVYAFRGSGASWGQEARIVPPPGAPLALFGLSIAVSEGLAAVGVEMLDGVVSIYQRESGVWRLLEQVNPSDEAPGDFFGFDVGISGTTVVTGADSKQIGANPSQGAAYVFDSVRQSGLPPPSLTEVRPNSGSALGGTAVTLKGSDFDRSMRVTFDGVAATNVVWLDSSTITATTPAHAAGTVGVTVFNQDGQSSTLLSAFTYIAPPPPPPTATTLTVSLGGTGLGRVVSAPAGIACGSDCTETYTTAPVVQLVAIPAADAGFAGWTGDADCADGSVTMTANRNCTARFQRFGEGRTLDVDGDGRGDAIGYAPAPTSTSPGLLTSVQAFSGVLRAGDINGDRRSDILGYDPATGAWTISLGGASIVTGSVAPRQSPFVFDVNGDGGADVVFHDPVAGRVQTCIPVPGGLDCRAPIAVPTGVALFPLDVNGDGRGDLLNYRWATGEGTFLLGGDSGVFTNTSLTIAGLAGNDVVVIDVNGDRRSDLIFSDPIGGASTLFVNGGSAFSTVDVGNVPGFTLRAARLDGDARGDLVAYNAATGQTLQALNNGTAFTISASQLPAGRQIFTSDVNGDNRSDVLLYDPATGAITIATSQANGTFTQQQGTSPPGLTILASQ